MPAARFWPAERIAASGVLSSWVTPVTNSSCWRARRCARCAEATSTSPVAPSSASTPKPVAEVAPLDRGDRRLEGAAAVPRHEQPGALFRRSGGRGSSWRRGRRRPPRAALGLAERPADLVRGSGSGQLDVAAARGRPTPRRVRSRRTTDRSERRRIATTNGALAGRPKCASASRGSRRLAQVVLVERHDQHAAEAEAAAGAGAGGGPSGPNTGSTSAERLLEDGARAEREAARPGRLGARSASRRLEGS